MANLTIKNYIILFSVLFIIILLLIFLGIASDQINWADWIGVEDYTSPDGVFHRGKTLWDLFELLIFPLSIAIGVIIINWWQRKTELEVENKRFLDRTLQDYIDKMESLFLVNSSADRDNNKEFREIARVRTLTALRQLDDDRKGELLLFLNDIKAINSDDPLINLNFCDLTDVYIPDTFHLDFINLNGAFLNRARLGDVTLRKAHFRDAKLVGATLWSSNCSGADFKSAFLMGADLSFCNLQSADLRGANLQDIRLEDIIADIKEDPDKLRWFKEIRGREIKNGMLHTNLIHAYLEGALYDELTLWPDGFDPAASGAVVLENPGN